MRVNQATFLIYVEYWERITGQSICLIIAWAHLSVALLLVQYCFSSFYRTRTVLLWFVSVSTTVLKHNQWCHPIDDCCINVYKVTLALAWQWVGLSFNCTWNSKSAGVLWVYWISQCKVTFLTSVLCSCYAQ